MNRDMRPTAQMRSHVDTRAIEPPGGHSACGESLGTSTERQPHAHFKQLRKTVRAGENRRVRDRRAPGREGLVVAVSIKGALHRARGRRNPELIVMIRHDRIRDTDLIVGTGGKRNAADAKGSQAHKSQGDHPSSKKGLTES